MENMNIKQTFLNLTSKTYPFGFESELESLLPKGFYQDTNGNYFYKIGDTKTAFTSHLDTACKEQVNVKHIFEGNIIKTDGTSILGADDKAGVTILLYMIEKNVPGLYCFFIGEEVGCIGSGLAAKDAYWKNYNRMISFDRRGTTSVITHQSSKRCCSDLFAQELAKQLNRSGLEMELDNTGVYTDSAEFVEVISECTNISVGYYSEHTKSERQDIKHLEQLCRAIVGVDWENLPTKRDQNKTEYKTWRNEYPKTQTKNKTEICESGYPEKSKYWKKYDRNDYHDYDEYNWFDDNYSTNIHHIDTSKVGRKYWENLEHEILDEDVEEKYFFESNTEYKPILGKSHYEAIKQSIFEDELTKEEFTSLSFMYNIDLDDPQDMDFYLEIRDML
jgi:hypothetical protein